MFLLLGRRFPSPIEAEISLNQLSGFAGPPLFVEALVEGQHDQESGKYLSSLQQNPQFLQHVVQASLFGSFSITYLGFSLGFGINVFDFLLFCNS
ncbi:MAG: hypothetical protein Q8R51_00750 [Azonexus sp.]|nr:hypothetical protein [Azonexus sp.]